MKSLRYKKIDAFTTGTSLGNPAASIFIEDQILSPQEMLMIAKQHKGFVSEVVFCEASDVADRKLTYYASECEVEFCGHGTIATMYEVIKNDPVLREKDIVRIETNKKGVLDVKNLLKTEETIYITAPEPEYLECTVDKANVAGKLGLTLEQISKEQTLGFIDAGLRTLLVPIEKLTDEVCIYPEEDQLREFCYGNQIDIILIYCFETSQKDCFVHTRVFAPKFGYLEDPATGSGNSALAYFMYRQGIWNGESVIIEQGGNDRIYNQVHIQIEEGRVLFGGRASLRIDGVYFI